MSNLVRRAINKRPRLSQVHQHKKSLELVFVLEGSIPGALKKEYPRVHQVLRRAKKEDEKAWPKILRKAYLEKESAKGKRIQRGLHQYLHELLERALLILLEQAQEAEKFYPGIEKDIPPLREIATRRRGHPKSKRRQEKEAKRFARIYEVLKPEVTALRTFVKNHISKDDEVVGNAAEKMFQYSWLHHAIHGNALKNLPTSTSCTESKSQLPGKWQAWQLTVGVMYEQQNPPKRFEPNTIAKYISIGRSLLPKKKLRVKRPA